MLAQERCHLVSLFIPFMRGRWPRCTGLVVGIRDFEEAIVNGFPFR
jgi:hypothetical protein